MDGLFRSEPFTIYGSGSRFSPSLEVKETKDALVVTADLPGVEQKDLEVSFEKNQLTIEGHRESEENEDGVAYCACERSYGHFHRTVTLPDGVETEGVKGELKNGVLTLRMPKKPEILPKRIPVEQIEG